MPIYDYQCSSCGHKAELMRKVSEAVSKTCPQCGQASFEKQVSAPNFQLNGTGWYASDFKGSSPAKKTEDAAPAACATGCACH